MEQTIKETIEIVKKGGTILYPTDTSWAIGGLANDESCIKKIHQIKQENKPSPMVLLIDDISKLNRFVVKIPDIAYDIVEYAEKPLTVIYPKGKNLPGELLGPTGSVAIRITKDPFCIKLIHKLDQPIIATLFSPSKIAFQFSDIPSSVLEQVDHVVRHRTSELLNKQLSKILQIEVDGTIQFLRK